MTYREKVYDLLGYIVKKSMTYAPNISRYTVIFGGL